MALRGRHECGRQRLAQEVPSGSHHTQDQPRGGTTIAPVLSPHWLCSHPSRLGAPPAGLDWTTLSPRPPGSPIALPAGLCLVLLWHLRWCCVFALVSYPLAWRPVKAGAVTCCTSYTWNRAWHGVCAQGVRVAGFRDVTHAACIVTKSG